MDLSKPGRSFRGNAAAAAGPDPNALLVIKLPDPRMVRVISRSVFLALVFISLPCVVRILGGSGSGAVGSSSAFDHAQFDSLLRGLAEEGLLRRSDKTLIVCDRASSASQSLNLKNFHADQMVMVVDSASERQSSLFFDESFDFVYVSDPAADAGFAERVVKTGGILAFPLADEYANSLREKSNYKIVYIRRYSSTIVAMRKVDVQSPMLLGKRRLLQSSPTEASKAEALNELEEALMEPPRLRRRRSLSKDPANYSTRIKFLPQLLGDGSLVGFQRRVFVNVGLPEQNRDVKQWFDRNYPKMRQDFEVYDLNAGRDDVSGWARRNLREDEYVVMKAEAGVVEEMVEGGTIRLVDELFMECNNQWWKAGTKTKKKKKSERAYWECLALYGRVKDEGVAVHQWWG